MKHSYRWKYYSKWRSKQLQEAIVGIGTFNLAETADLKVNNEATIEKLNAVSLSTSVYSATPPITNLALGQIYIVENGGTVTLEVKTASGVNQKVALT